MKSKKCRFLAILMMIVLTVSTMSVTAFAAVKVGHASISEAGTINGKKGDSTGREVTIREWYDKEWNLVLRPNSAALAEKSAKACEEACANDNIGYGVADRNSAYESYQKVGAVSKITKSNTDDGALMTLCAIAGGCTKLNYKGNAPTNSTIRKVFAATGEYTPLTDRKFLTSDKYLKRGDILVREGTHTVMVLSNGANASNITNGLGADTATQSMLMVKASASKNNKIVLSWNKIADAKSYVIYGAQFKNKIKKIATVKTTKYTVKKISKKKLKSHKSYKFYVVAKGKSNEGLANSDTVNCITANTMGKYANVKSIKRTVKSINLKVSETADLTKCYKLTMYSKKLHLPESYGMPVLYLSSNPLVASVDYKGELIAYGPGTSTIYIRDISGKYCTVKVTVEADEIDGPEKD